MHVIKGFMILIFVVGIIFLTVYFMSKSEISQCDKQIVYKYLPRTLEEEETEPIFVSEIFGFCIRWLDIKDFS